MKKFDKHIPYVIQGDFSKEFLEKMGYKPFVPPPIFNTIKEPMMPLETVKLAYSIKIKYPMEKNGNS